MSKLGTTNIKSIMLGSTEITKAYLGTNVVYEKSNPLPYDAEVEWIQSTGSEYIDTGIVPTSDIRLTIDGLYTTTSNNGLIHGCIDLNGNTYRRFHLGIAANKWQGGIGTAFSGTGSPNTSRHIFQISGKNGTAYVDATSIAGNTAAFPSISMYLFARNFSGTASNMGSFKMYSAHVYRYSTGEKLVDFIPVRKNGVGYLYDKISDTLFGTSTGSFILGADKD